MKFEIVFYNPGIDDCKENWAIVHKKGCNDSMNNNKEYEYGYYMFWWESECSCQVKFPTELIRKRDFLNKLEEL